jgi:hypothetical protein
MPFDLQTTRTRRATAATLTPAQRLRRLIEFHLTLETNYALNYGQAVGALRAVIDVTIGPTEQQKAALVADLTQLRDGTARLYATTIKSVEFAINELAPGTFDIDGLFSSDEWTLEERKEFLRDLADASLAASGAAALMGAAPAALFGAGFALGIYGTLAAGEGAGWW